MAAMDARRLELYDLALPADPENLATKDDLARVETRLEAKIDSLGAGLLAHLDSRIAQLEATLTRRMVSIMGAWTVLIGSAFAWAAVLLR